MKILGNINKGLYKGYRIHIDNVKIILYYTELLKDKQNPALNNKSWVFC